jgi:octaprenyl-diphosphate synthase
LGVISAGSLKDANEEQALIKTLSESSEILGMGFQVLDDVKNLTEGNPGKKRGDDVVEGKKSLPVLLYLHKNPEKKDFVAKCFSSAREKGTEAAEVEEFIEKLRISGSIDTAKELGQSFIDKAQENFTKNCGKELIDGFFTNILK